MEIGERGREGDEGVGEAREVTRKEVWKRNSDERIKRKMKTRPEILNREGK